MSWDNSALTFNLDAIGTLAFHDLTPVPMNSAQDPPHGTAVCKRLIMSFTADQTAAVANVPQQFGVGVYVQTAQAILALEILAPLANPGQDWYYWTARSTFQDSIDLYRSISWEVDIRTQRKLREGYGLILVMEGAAANTSTLVVTASVRGLWAKTA